jgi:DNA-binding LacI/PurR family transcriptional regulator
MAYEVGLGSERLCTIKEIADRAALGAGTVHRALKGGRLVSAETRRLVLDTVRLLNEEKIARAARLEHAVEKMHTSYRQPISQPFGE